jgi:hypothetical protein
MHNTIEMIDTDFMVNVSNNLRLDPSGAVCGSLAWHRGVQSLILAVTNVYLAELDQGFNVFGKLPTLEATSAVLFLGLYLHIDEPERMLILKRVVREYCEDPAAEERTRTRRPGIYPKLRKLQC